MKLRLRYGSNRVETKCDCFPAAKVLVLFCFKLEEKLKEIYILFKNFSTGVGCVKKVSNFGGKKINSISLTISITTMNIKRFFIGLLALLFLQGCAGTYKSLQPNTLSYGNRDSVAGVSLAYQYDILLNSRNKKYWKKEQKKGVRLVAVKITNNTSRELKFNTDFQLISDNAPLPILPNKAVYSQLKQQPATHLLYLLLTPMQGYVTTSDPNKGVKTSTFPIGLILGPGLSLGNLAVSSSANGEFREELNQFDLENNVIGSGETRYALIGIQQSSFSSIRVRLIENMAAKSE
mgnify:CR=1 FL=1